jgi:hypothetical protein
MTRENPIFEDGVRRIHPSEISSIHLNSKSGFKDYFRRVSENFET